MPEFRFTHDVPIRFSDLDLLGHVNQSVYHEILEEGRLANKPVTIHVEVFNPARRLYERLGFQHVDSSGAYHLMRWSPDHVNTAS